MSWLDNLIIITVLFCVFLGFYRGIIKEVFSILSIFLGYIVASQRYKVLYPFFHTIFKNSTIASAASFITVFFLFIICFMFIVLILRKGVKAVGLSPVDRVFGAIFGLIKGSLIVAIILFFLLTFFPNSKKTIDRSPIAKNAVMLAKTISKILPKTNLYSKFQKGLKELKSIGEKK